MADVDDEDDEPPMIICCQGPPACLSLEGDAAQAAMNAGCVWCKRITVLADGTEHVVEPSTA